MKKIQNTNNKNKNFKKRREKVETPLPEVSDNSHIGIVRASKGDCRFDVQMITSTSLSKTYICSLMKGQRRGPRVQVDKYVLFTIPDYGKDDSNKGYILHLYDENEVEFLKRSGEIVNVEELQGTTNSGFEFTNATEDDTVKIGNDGEIDMSFI